MRPLEKASREANAGRDLNSLHCYLFLGGGGGFGVIGTRLVGAGGFFGVLEGVSDPLTPPVLVGRRAPWFLALICQILSLLAADSSAPAWSELAGSLASSEP